MTRSTRRPSRNAADPLSPSVMTTPSHSRYWAHALTLRGAMGRIEALAGFFHENFETQKSLRALEATRDRERRQLFDAQDGIDARRDELIGRVEQQLAHRHTSQTVLMFWWRLA